MAVLIAVANGDLTGAATWGLVEQVLDAENSNTALTTNYVETQTFTVTAGDYLGVAVKLASRAAVPSGTISVRIAEGGVTVAGTEVTINVSDLPQCDTTEKQGGWVLFKFAAPVALAGATNYTVSAKTSAASQVNLYRNSTGGNWSRLVLSDDTQAPAAGDVMHIMGHYTGAGSRTDFSVDMDQTAATDYGAGTDNVAAFTISQGGTLNYEFAATTNYYLKLSGDFIIYSGGTFTMGTVANPIPRDSTAVLEFDPVSDGGNGLIVRGTATVTIQGLSRTAGKNITWCQLSANEAAGQTELSVDQDTGWLSGDVIVIAPTDRNCTHYEERILDGDAAADHIDITAATSYAHLGTSPMQAEVILLTRNVKVRSATATIMAYSSWGIDVTVDIDWAEFYRMGYSTSFKSALYVKGTTNSFSFNYSAVHDGEGKFFYSSSGVGQGQNITLMYSVFYKAGTVLMTDFGGSATPYSVTYCVFMIESTTSAEYAGTVQISGPAAMTFQYNRCVAYHGGIVFGWGYDFSNVKYNICHDCTGSNYGVGISATRSGLRVYENTIYRCRWGVGGVYDSTYYGAIDMELNDLTIWGCISPSFRFAKGSRWIKLTLRNCLSNGDSVCSTPYALECNDTLFIDVKLINCNFGTASGIFTAHTSADLCINPGGSNSLIQILLENTTLASATPIAYSNDVYAGSYIKMTRLNGTSGNHISYIRYGTFDSQAWGIWQADATYHHTASPSTRLTPGDASLKFEGPRHYVAIANGDTATVGVWIRKSSAAAGGADYNGNQPRLVVKANPAMGIAADTVLDTATVGLDSWENLSGVTPAVTADGVVEVVVDCDGTTGFVNTDDWSVS